MTTRERKYHGRKNWEYTKGLYWYVQNYKPEEAVLVDTSIDWVKMMDDLKELKQDFINKNYETKIN